MSPNSTDVRRSARTPLAEGPEAASAELRTTERPTANLLNPDVDLERRGLWWLLGAFLFCPCHLPLTVGVLTGVLAGTSLGAVLRDHTWIAGTLITVTWLAGTAYGFRLIHRAKQAGGACPTK